MRWVTESVLRPKPETTGFAKACKGAGIFCCTLLITPKAEPVALTAASSTWVPTTLAAILPTLEKIF